MMFHQSFLTTVGLIASLGVGLGPAQARAEDPAKERPAPRQIKKQTAPASTKEPTAEGKSTASESFADRRTPNQFWWPERLDVSPLRLNGVESDPFRGDLDYAREFAKLDLQAVKADISRVLTTSQEWWPADYGHYGPFFIRMAWHSAGTYRTIDGRGGAASGQQRFEPLNSWPDNVNLDKARRLLWPVKAKYGRALSWADLIVLTGNVSLESMGFKTFGFAGGRRDAWEADQTYWGPEQKFLADDRHTKDRKLKGPLAAVQMGLIYVNPEGPNGKPDPIAAAYDIRQNFGRMAMDDEETVALIAGGHSFGKAHGAVNPAKCVAAAPAGAPLEEQGLGWKSKCGSGKAGDTVTSGLEGAWVSTPTKFSMQYLANLYAFEWVKTKSPAGATQWVPKNKGGEKMVPDAQDPQKRHAPIMFTTDLALKEDPAYRKITKRWLEHPEEFEAAFAKAWFKLTHRDMGPRARYVGAEVPKDALLWQDPIPEAEKKALTQSDVSGLKSKLLASGLSNQDLVRTAWAAAASFRGTDMRGGANGGRLRLAPQKDWAVNDPAELAKVLEVYEKLRGDWNKSNHKVSMADLIVLGGTAGVERAAKDAGLDLKLTFTPGRADASAEQTDVTSFAVLEPKADAFRNYYGPDNYMNPLNAMIDRAQMLKLSIPEMVTLIGGLRVLGANAGGSPNGVLTASVGKLTNDFFFVQPPRHVDPLAKSRRHRPPVRGLRPQDGRAEVEGHAGRSDHRFALRATFGRGSVRAVPAGSRSSPRTSAARGPK